MISSETIAEKVAEIKNELKRLGLYKKTAPEWVLDFTQQHIATQEDFAGWLQFVYLPNRLQDENRPMDIERLIVPQALRFFGDDLKKGRLLQLLIELDSL